VVLFADSRFHNGPGNSEPYLPLLTGSFPATYEDTLALYREREVRVVGIFRNLDSTDNVQLARVVREAEPDEGVRTRGVIVAPNPTTLLAALVIGGIEELLDSLAPDLSAFAVDPDPSDGIDVRAVVAEIVPLSAQPPSGVGALDIVRSRFVDVQSGTELTFRVVLRNDAIPAGDLPRTFQVEIALRNESGVSYGSTRIDFTVPARDGTSCERE